MKTRLLLTSVLILFLIIGEINAQTTLSIPRASQRAVVTQRVGITDITITYHRPRVSERDIWGSLVPYDMDGGFPWRAGSNETTTISFSDDVKIEGKEVKAGEYGFYLLVSENGKATVILSTNSRSWGSFSYKAENDALRAEVQTEEIAHREWMTFEFTEVNAKDATLALIWEKKKIPFKIEADVDQLVVARIKDELTGNHGGFWLNFASAATYAATTEYKELSDEWAETAISNSGNHANAMVIKANILYGKDDIEGGDKVMDEALMSPTATVFTSYAYGRTLIGQKRNQRAMDVFKKQEEKYPDTWFAPHGLARGYSALGDYKKALKYEKVALGKAPDGSKGFLEGYIKLLEEGKDFN